MPYSVLTLCISLKNGRIISGSSQSALWRLIFQANLVLTSGRLLVNSVTQFFPIGRDRVEDSSTISCAISRTRKGLGAAPRISSDTIHPIKTSSWRRDSPCWWLGSSAWDCRPWSLPRSVFGWTLYARAAGAIFRNFPFLIPWIAHSILPSYSTNSWDFLRAFGGMVVVKS